MNNFILILYKKFKYHLYKQWYWVFRLDLTKFLIFYYPQISFNKQENKLWQLNKMLDDISEALQKTETLPIYSNKFAFIYGRN
jgi:hypothetical protein